MSGPLTTVYHVYILKSLKDKRTYVGYTKDLEERLRRHNSGQVAATKHQRPLRMLISEQFETSEEAKKREQYWKHGGGRRKLKQFFRRNNIEIC